MTCHYMYIDNDAIQIMTQFRGMAITLILMDSNIFNNDRKTQGLDWNGLITWLRGNVSSLHSSEPELQFRL